VPKGIGTGDIVGLYGRMGVWTNHRHHGRGKPPPKRLNPLGEKKLPPTVPNALLPEQKKREKSRTNPKGTTKGTRGSRPRQGEKGKPTFDGDVQGGQPKTAPKAPKREKKPLGAHNG